MPTVLASLPDSLFDILMRIYRGQTNAEIAADRQTCLNTVRRQVKLLYERLEDADVITRYARRTRTNTCMWLYGIAQNYRAELAKYNKNYNKVDLASDRLAA